MKDETIIGQVTISYTETGVPSFAGFKPIMEIKLSGGELLEKLSEFQHDKNSREHVEESASLVFATWFNKMNEIELADREKFEIVARTIDCQTYLKGNVKLCVINFVFKERTI